MQALFEKFDRVDTALNRWLVVHSIALLRISLGFVFLAFGALKFFPGTGAGYPHHHRAHRRGGSSKRGAGAGRRAGGRHRPELRHGEVLARGSMADGSPVSGSDVPLVLFHGELFSGPHHAPTLVAQYIIKDVVLVMAGMVISSTWTGARIVAEPRSMKSTLGEGLHRLEETTGEAPEEVPSVRELRARVRGASGDRR